jgi:uncharacterized protein YukE
MRNFLWIILVAVGCGTPSGTEGADRASAAGDSVSRFKDELARTDASIGKAVAALDDISRNIATDARPALNAFAQAVSELDTQAAALGSAIGDMNSKMAAYLDAWEKEAGSIVNPELRLRAMDRRKDVRESMAKIEAVLKEARPPLLDHRTQLHDVRTYLSNDLTPKGLAVVKDVQAKARENAGKVRTLLKPVGEQAARVALEISPARK